ncbi:MAG: peptide chain release factor N(5)-glutamine methyltransferase [Bdellovibrionales bacterium]|nr:peptide chain release factor N(5)-glutamine methyltransferase [Bdellovibrionales bacterium]
MTVKNLLNICDLKIDKLSFSLLDKKNIKRDLRHLLSKLVPCAFNELFLFYTKIITEKNQNIFNSQFNELITGKPLAYILKEQSFYKSVFFVDNRVLIPRMETELLVETVLKYFSTKKNLFFADFGTGSGCIVISLLKELLNSRAVAIDISSQALDVAKYNAEKMSVNSKLDFYNFSVKKFIDSNTSTDLNQTCDFIVANPPYIGQKSYVQPFVKIFEPNSALFADNKGLEFLLSWAKMALVLLKPNAYYFFEFGDNQKNDLKPKLNLLFSEVSFLKDLQGIYRIAICKK